jgi:YidC/Oxa1 family membrane protein insertase
MFVAAFLVLMYGQRFMRQNPPPAEVRREVSREIQGQPQAPAASPGAMPSASPAPSPGIEEPTFATAQADQKGATVTRLGNSFVTVSFTDSGGAILDVAFKKYPAVQGESDPFIFNEPHADAMMAFAGVPGLDRSTRYKLVSCTDSEVVYRTVLDETLEVTRRYTLSPDKSPTSDPYLIRCETTLRNLTDKASAPLRVQLSLGTAAPSNALDNGYQLTTEFWNGKDTTLVRRSELEQSGGMLGYGAHGPRPVIAASGPIVWATVKNQFFSAILTPDEAAAGLETRRVKLLDRLPDADRRAYGITGDVNFDVPAIAAHAEARLAGSLYVGPKEYPRLSNTDVFKRDQDRVMDLGSFIFRFCAAILLTLMTWIHGWTANWGVAIILTTLALKVAFLPLSISQARSSRRMQKLMPEMKVIREKFKDNPQKQQAAMMELYKQHKVNPLGGCLPMLLTIPFFFAFFKMLQSAAELRYAPFLWAHDLSSPDTVFAIPLPYIGSFGINILPILFCLTLFYQMRLTPQPAVDNAQMKMMKLMPLMSLFIYYNYSCALSLYSTANGLFIIFQQVIVNRGHDDEEKAQVRPGKPTKNVTPKKR